MDAVLLGEALQTEFVLVDFENVQPKDLALLNGRSYKIKIFLGTHQGKIPVTMARALQAFGRDVEYVQAGGSGNNAVDFHIAYYIGQLAATAPQAHFHVISKDTGFDPLIKYLEEQGIRCRRSESIGTIDRIETAVSAAALIADRVNAVITNLAKQKSARPRTLKTLRTSIKALLRTEDHLDGIIELLTTRGVLKISDGKVQYDLP
jgi:hypothetical protein